jgi:hypothetical protein
MSIASCAALHYISEEIEALYGFIDILIARLEVDLLILVAVVACAGVDVDATHFLVGRTTRCLACVSLGHASTVCGLVLAGGRRHALGRGNAPSEVAKARANRIQLRGSRCPSDAGGSSSPRLEVL